MSYVLVFDLIAVILTGNKEYVDYLLDKNIFSKSFKHLNRRLVRKSSVFWNATMLL